MKTYFKILLLLFPLFVATLANSQQKATTRSHFSLLAVNKQVIIKYRFPENSGTDKVNIILYRGNEKNENVKAIQQLNDLPVSADYYHIDSTLPAQGTYQYTLEVIAGNTTLLRETKTVYAYPAGLSPMIKSFTGQAKKGTAEVTIKWDIANTFLAGNLTLARSRNRESGFTTIAVLKNTDRSFLDIVNDANEPFFYQLQVPDLSKSTILTSITIYVLPDFVIKPIPAQNVRGLLKNNQPNISWQSGDQASRGFYVFKKTIADRKFTQASGIIVSNNNGQFSWTDSTSQLKPGQSYQYTILSESNSYTKSEPSDTVTVIVPGANLQLLPPEELRLVQDNDSLRIVWTIPEGESELTDEYIVYQKSKTDRDYKVIGTRHAIEMINYINILLPEPGSSFIVKAKSGNKESLPTEPAVWIGKTKSTEGPQFLKAEIIDGVLNITWLNIEDPAIREFNLYKWQGRSYVLVQTVNNSSTSIQVRNYTPGEKNQYMLTSVNTKGTESKGSSSLTVY